MGSDGRGDINGVNLRIVQQRIDVRVCAVDTMFPAKRFKPVNILACRADQSGMFMRNDGWEEGFFNNSATANCRKA